jgi:hypothetical protein
MFDVVPNGGDVVLSEIAPPPVLSNPAFDTTSGFTFQLTGQAGLNYAIYSSADLINWSPRQTIALSDASTNITIPAPDTFQFYRAQWVP